MSGAGTPTGRGTGLAALVDARALHVSGIGRYLREVLARLLRDPRFARVTLLGPVAELRGFVDSVRPPGEVAFQRYPPTLYDPRAQAAWLGLRLRGRARADVTFFPHYDTPLLAFPRSAVVTVHDLIHFRLPGTFPAPRRAAAGVILARAVARSAQVIAVSASTRADLLERFPAAAGKIRVIPNGVALSLDGADAEPSNQPPPVPGPFLLCVGNRKPHKNLDTAVEALALLRTGMPELKLVVLGRGFPEWESTRRLAQRRGVGHAIVEVENAGDAELVRFYRHCRALLFPSFYEGFGLPVLEAMACGAPVVASDRSSLPEVVGDAGLLADPEDAESFAAAVRRLETDAALRAELVERGRRRAAGFSWERSAGATVDLLHAVASDHG